MENGRLFRTLVVENEAVRDGHFEFGPKCHSRFLIDFGRILQNPENTGILVSRLFGAYKDQDVTKVLTPNSAEGYVLAQWVAARFNAKSFHAERRHGRVYLPEYSDIKRTEKILLIDDGINTGNSMEQLLRLVREKGGNCVGIAVCVNRHMCENEGFMVPVYSVFRLSKTYPLTNLDEGDCDECLRLGQIIRRLRTDVDGPARNMLTKEKIGLELHSAYADWRY